MLGAYFDDSGSHDQSEVVVVAGVMGLESELQTLENLWRDHLDQPLDGLKTPLKEFHARDCFASEGEFTGWKRTETDYFRHQLRETIIRSRVSGYGFACVRSEFDTEIQGEFRSIFGDSEAFATTNCFVRALRWARNCTFDPEMTFVFDNKPQRNNETKALFDAFQMHEASRDLIGVSFLDSKKTLPLQAADLFAWEFYQYAKQILRKGMSAPDTEGMKHLAKGMYYRDGQIARQAALKKIKAHWRRGGEDMIHGAAELFAKIRPSSLRAGVRQHSRKMMPPR
jgi:hypothetical protein